MSDLIADIRAALEDAEERARDWSEDAEWGAQLSVAGEELLRHIAADRKILDEFDKARTWALMYRTDPEVGEHHALARVVRLLAEAYGVPVDTPY